MYHNHIPVTKALETVAFWVSAKVPASQGEATLTPEELGWEG